MAQSGQARQTKRREAQTSRPAPWKIRARKTTKEMEMKKICMVVLLSLAAKFNLGAVPQSINGYWGIIAKSSDIHIINSADLKSHLPDMESSVRNGYYYYQVPVVETLKGTRVDAVKIRVYLEQGFIDHVKTLPDNAKLIVFFVNLYTSPRLSGADEFNNYIAGGEYREGIVIYTGALYKEISSEIRKQQIILREKLYESFAKDETMNRKIKRIIDELVIEEREMAAFDELLAMGREAVPYIILHMDDYRELPIKYARVEINDPDWWESMAQYSPKLVIDTLEIVLTGLTKVNFGYTWNGGINEERRRILDGWRIYLYYLINTGSIPE
jgi:hypothetical protein